MSSVYDEGPLARIPRKVRDVLAADAGLLAFTEGHISEGEDSDLENAIPLPSIWIVPLAPNEQRQVGGFVEINYDLALFLALPRSTPATAEIAAPTAPTVAAGATGSLTGTYQYRLTAYGAAGESYASAAASVSVSGKDVTVTPASLPSGAIGFRIWRTKAGQSAFRWAGVSIGAGPWTDNTPDSALGDELAPIRYYGQRVIEEASSVLYNAEPLFDVSEDISDASLKCYPGPDRLVSSRNMRLKTLVITVPALIDPVTKTFAM